MPLKWEVYWWASCEMSGVWCVGFGEIHMSPAVQPGVAQVDWPRPPDSLDFVLGSASGKCID